MHGSGIHQSGNTAWTEHQILNHVKQSLRVTLDWKVPSVGLSRKLSSLLFILKSYQRHLERLMKLEEENGYMEVVSDTKPNMQCRIDRLVQDHVQFRNNVGALLPMVEGMTDCRSEQLEEVCNNIHDLLAFVDRHDAEEIELLQESFLYDEGGEG